MCYSIEPKDRIHVKGYGFLSIVKNICKNLSNKYSQKLLDSAKKSEETKAATYAIKTASKRATLKTAEATGDFIGNKIAEKITSVSKKSSQNNLEAVKSEEDIPKKIYISIKKTHQIIDELRLV